MKEHDSPFSVVLYEADAPTAWLPSGGDIEAPPWERCFAQFLRQIYDRSRSEKSVRDYRRTLFAFFASSAQGGPPKHPEDHTREDVEDFLRFFSMIPTDTVKGLRDRAIFLLYFWTARRREEIARLRWGDIEQATIVDEFGGHKQGWRYRFYGKGKSGQQDMAELPLPAKIAIDRYLRAARRMHTMTSDAPLFVAIGPEQGGGKRGVTLPIDDHTPLTSRAIAHALKHYASLAGIDAERLSIHSWRHTSAQRRYEAGEDVRSLQRLLRHSNIATTDIYVRGLMGTADPGASLLEERFAHLSDPH